MPSLIRILAAVVAVAWTSLALANGIKPFDQGEFDRLTQAGKPVVVVVHATWCPTCKVQKPIQQQLMSEAEFKDYTMFTVDFDADKPILGEFKVNHQATMIVFKGRVEAGRSVGETSRAGLQALMAKAAG